MTKPKYRLNGYQLGLTPEDGCYLYTILKGKAKGATLVIESPENTPPTEQTILVRVLEKERQFANK